MTNAGWIKACFAGRYTISVIALKDFTDFARKSTSSARCNVTHDRLTFILNQIRNGASPHRESLESLIEQSFIEVPCSQYQNCKGHKFDPGCKHRK
jgi:hypothetical protein